MKLLKLILFVVIMTFCFACETKRSQRVAIVQIPSIETTYFENDSLQRKAGYDIPIVYIGFIFHNTSKDTVFLPFKTTRDTLLKSNINIINGDIDFHYYFKGKFKHEIPPNDSIGILAIVRFDYDLIFNNNVKLSDKYNFYHILRNFSDNMSLKYQLDKSDAIFSKYPLPDTVIFKNYKDLKMQFRDKESIGEQINWIL